jgi:hypothetical protein
MGQLIDLMTVAEVCALNECDRLILTELAKFLSQRNSELDSQKCELIATAVLKAANELLWLAFARNEPDRQQLIAETKTLIATYLQTYRI